MLIIMISIILTLILFILTISNAFKKHKKGLKRVFAIVLSITIIFSLIAITNEITAPAQKERDMMEYNTIYYKGQNNYTLDCREIIKYNSKVFTYKSYGTWFVTDWFFYPGCDTLPYISIKGNTKTVEPNKTMELKNYIPI